MNEHHFFFLEQMEHLQLPVQFKSHKLVQASVPSLQFDRDGTERARKRMIIIKKKRHQNK